MASTTPRVTWSTTSLTSTLKPLLASKSVAQARLLKVVDPSCGSGSFLIAAYQYLLDWHQQKYAQYKRPVDRARFLMTGIDGPRTSASGGAEANPPGQHLRRGH